MICSMTGFGDASAQQESVHYSVELRSVNNRYFKAALHLPPELGALEPEIESLLRRQFSRGSLTLSVSYKDTSAHAAQQINSAALRAYIEQIHKIAPQPSQPLDLTVLLALPGVIQPPDQSDLIQRAKPVLFSLIDRASQKMLQMRLSEGRSLVEEVGRHLQTIEVKTQLIVDRAPRVMEEYHQKLRQRANELLARSGVTVNDADLLREVALYADRCDVTEEVHRLRAHLSQFAKILTKPDGEPVGRTLDFLAQELLREANTMASKSNDAPIAQNVVEIKSAIDRIKEQVQNLE